MHEVLDLLAKAASPPADIDLWQEDDQFKISALVRYFITADR